MIQAPYVVKVGGSLYDLPDLGERLGRWLDAFSQPALLVPGGGAMVDVLRDLDQRHRLSADPAHWLALRLLSVAAHFLKEVVGGRARLATHIGDVLPLCNEGFAPVLDCFHFCQQDRHPLPASWDVTSDSVAARAAVALGAPRVILLKSTDYSGPFAAAEAQRGSLVDPYFDRARVRPDGSLLDFEWVNFRKWNGTAGAD